MSDAPTVPMFDPQGTLRDIPYEQMKDAIAHGANPGVRVKAPDGSIRVVPSGKLTEAAQNGGKILPIEDQPTEHHGFWSAVSEDVGPALKGLGLNLLGAPYQAYSGVKKGLDELQTYQQTGKTQEQLQNQQQKAAGYGPIYRNVLTPAAQAVGVNVPAMEQAAAQGDVAGVAGRTAVPFAMAAAPLVGEAGLNAAKAVAPAVGTAAKVGLEVGKGAAKLADLATFERASKAINAVKETAGNIKEIVNPTPPTVEQLRQIAAQNPTPENIRAWWQARGGAVAPEPIERNPSGSIKGARPISGEVNSQPASVPAGTSPDATILQQAEALRQPVSEAIDKAIPPTGKGKLLNFRTKAQADFYLQKGNIDAAKEVVDKATGGDSDVWDSLGMNGDTSGNTPKPELVKSEPQPEIQKPAPSKSNLPNTAYLQQTKPFELNSTNEIRAEMQARAARTNDLLEDRQIQQNMQQRLDQDELNVERTKRREFIAGNSTGMTKTELIKQAGGVVPERAPRVFGDEPVLPPRKPPEPESLSDLKASIDRQAELLKNAGASDKAIQDMRNARQADYSQRVQKFKNWQIQKAKGVKPGTTVPGNEDLTDILKKSLEQAKKKKPGVE